MKVIHVPYAFYPDPSGGTEVYVETLARELRELSVDSVVVAPGAATASYEHEGLPVRRFELSGASSDLRQQYGAGNANAGQAFGAILDAEQPSVVHLHAFTGLLSGELVRQTKCRGLPLVFTYHTPTVSCQRATLLRWGTDVCDGVLRVGTCAACTLHGLGLQRSISQLLGASPVIVGRLAAGLGVRGRAQTALRMSELTTVRHAAIRSVLGAADVVVAVCDWATDVLQRNGVPAAKIVRSRHGLTTTPIVARGDRPVGGPLRIAFLGRLDPTKGAALLVQALGTIASAPLQLDIFGVVQGRSDAKQRRRLEALANGDPRIRFMEPVSNDKVVRLLQGYHALAVPSQCLETGPMVVLEAFAAGTPVIGTRLGGIAELVSHDVDGLLVSPGSSREWEATLERVVADPTLLPRLRRSVRPPRRMHDVAADMFAVYTSLVLREQLRQSQ